jgi:hypothetical protein
MYRVVALHRVDRISLRNQCNVANEFRPELRLGPGLGLRSRLALFACGLWPLAVAMLLARQIERWSSAE